jgi:MFS family permease
MNALQHRAAAQAPTAFHATILLVCICFAVLASAILGPVLPSMQRDFADVPNAQMLVRLVVTVPMLVLAFCSTLAGALSDRIGRKRLLVGSLVLYGLCGTAPTYLHSLDAILATRAGVGLAESAIMACSTALIGDYFSGRQRDRFMSLQTTIAAISAFVFNTIGGMLGEYGWRVPFGVYALSLLLLPLVSYFIWEPERGAAQAAGASDVQPTGDVPYRPALLAWTCFVALVVGVAFMIVPVHFSFLLVDIGTHEPQKIGLAYALNSVCVATGTLVFGWYIVGRYRVATQMLMSTFVAGVGFLLMAEAKDFSSMLVAGAINGLGCGVFLPMSVTWTMRILPRSRMGFGVGAFFAMFFFGNFLNPPIVLGVAGQLGSLAASVEAWGFALIAISFAAGVFCLLRGRLSSQNRPRNPHSALV